MRGPLEELAEVEKARIEAHRQICDLDARRVQLLGRARRDGAPWRAIAVTIARARGIPPGSPLVGRIEAALRTRAWRTGASCGSGPDIRVHR